MQTRMFFNRCETRSRTSCTSVRYITYRRVLPFLTWPNACRRSLAAWRVDFNLTLLSFETYVADLRRLIDFALSCRLPEPPRLLFVSSIAAVLRSEDPLPILEHAVPAAAAVGTGYGESKWVAETLLIEAMARTPLHAVIVRTGQVSGGINGYWNSSEWFPSMIQSASTVKCLPATSTEKVSTRFSRESELCDALLLTRHPADGIFHPSGRRRQGYRRHARFSKRNPPSRSPVSCTMELRDPTDSGHAFCPTGLLPRLGLPPRTHR